MKDIAEVHFKVLERIAVLGESHGGWKTELNLVSWNERDPKLDLRAWDPRHEHMGKGITLTLEEATALRVALEHWLSKA